MEQDLPSPLGLGEEFSADRLPLPSSSPLGPGGDFSTGRLPLPSPSPLGFGGDVATYRLPLPSPSSLPGHREPTTHPESSRRSINPVYRGIQNPRVSATLTPQDDSTLIDDKVSVCAEPSTDSQNLQDRPVTVRDMERFTNAIQDTIREIGRQFIMVLSEARRDESEAEDGPEE